MTTGATLAVVLFPGPMSSAEATLARRYQEPGVDGQYPENGIEVTVAPAATGAWIPLSTM